LGFKPFASELFHREHEMGDHLLNNVDVESNAVETQYLEEFINHTSSVSEAEPFPVKPCGCGICNNMFEMEKEFREHCYQFCYSPVDMDLVFAVQHRSSSS
jgi:hypothetical protein